ncbi:MAG TPA: glycine/sarcosine/betaine reductase component B subunit [Chloroflexota bacterium]|nr:glycine/sarcosine/betaine reductase component B subunit [Chloroflexota bacterium]
MFRLEVGSFPVRDVRLDGRTGWEDGVLTVDRDELLGMVREDPRIGWASLEAVRPGESVRVVNVYDVWQPMAKVEGPGQTYPALSGRDTAAVGQGRTHRLTGVGVVECSGSAGSFGRAAPGTDRVDNIPRGGFFDMSGPGSRVPYGRLNNLCLAMERTDEVSDEDWEEARRAACLRLCDRLAETVRRLEPTEREVFDTTAPSGGHADPALPGVVHVPMLWSRESFLGPRSGIGTAVYGLTRQSLPWLLQPTEVLDGAITRGPTWYQVNNPNVLHLARGHGRRWNFLGVIVGRTNWTAMAEKEVFAHRIAELARALGARGAIVTVDLRGARFVETVLSVQALERVGVKTVLLTLEETSEDGLAPPLLLSVPELVSVVSCGDGAVPGPFPAVERVIGAREPSPGDFAQHPGFRGGYGEGRYWIDYYGLGRYSGVDF